MVNSASARRSAGKLAFVFNQFRDVDFAIRVLIFTDDHGMGVLPQVETQGVARTGFKEGFLDPEVYVWIKKG
jgi:hypothetical protein